MSALDTNDVWIRLLVGAFGLLILLPGVAIWVSRRWRFSFLEQNRMLPGGRLTPNRFRPFRQVRNANRVVLLAGVGLVVIGANPVLSAMWPNPVTGVRSHILNWDAAGIGVSLLAFVVLTFVPWWGLDKLHPEYPEIPSAAHPPSSYAVDSSDPTCSIVVGRDPAYRGTIGLPRVLINGDPAGRIWSGRAVRRAMPAGVYRVRVVEALWGQKGSPTVEVELVPGRHVVMYVRPAPVNRRANPPAADGWLLLTIA